MRPGRAFAPEEEKAHVITHGVGILFILIAGPLLVIDAPQINNLQVGLLIYVLSFLFVFASSTWYHYTRNGPKRDRLRVLDHIAIYYFIAGTNTPFLLGLVDGSRGLLFMALMGLLVLLGTCYKLSGTERFTWFSLFFYLLLGWLGLLTVYLIYPKVGLDVSLLIVAGGVFYTTGTYFYKYDSRRWYHTIWHIFVLCGALAHFWAIWKIAS